jgi:hypothetical protein
VSASLLAGLGLGYDKMTEAGFRCFIPGTHKLLFHTQQFAPEQKDFLPASNQDMLLLDLESGKIRSIFPPGKASYFQVSPDGKLIWVLSADHLDVVRLNGTLVSRLRNYPPVSNETYTGMPDLYWTQDSTKLSLVLPPRQTAMGYTGPEPRTVWQYSLGETSGSEVHLEPAPVGGNFSISPDGNWIVYYYYPIQEDSNTSVPPGIYIGDLRKGSSSLVDFVFWDQNGPIGDKIPGWFEWSPDSMHFIFNDTHEQIYLGDIQGKIITLPERGFDSWLDSRHYLFGRWAMGEIDGSNAVQVIQWPKSFAGRYIEDRTINYAGESIQTNP